MSSVMGLFIENGYIGVTAMTGGVVDKHQMIGVQLYNKILVDPYMLGVDYTLKQMPMLWEDMRVRIHCSHF